MTEKAIRQKKVLIIERINPVIAFPFPTPLRLFAIPKAEKRIPESDKIISVDVAPISDTGSIP